MFLIDNYGAELSAKISEIENKLKLAGIKYIIRDNNRQKAHCNGWVDFDVLGERRFFSDEEIKRKYRTCALPNKMHFCFNLSDGKMFPCGPVQSRFSLGLTVSAADYIDLYHPECTVSQLQSKIKAILEGDFLDTCAYCNGMCEDSERFVPAEQLTVEELRKIHTEKY